MPLYEYRCAAGHRFEKIQSFSAPEQLECPKCGQMGERLLSAPAIQFKGSGFYLTDYGKAGGSQGTAGKTENSESKQSGSGEKTAAASSTPAPASSGAPASSPSTSNTGNSTGSSSPAKQ